MAFTAVVTQGLAAGGRTVSQSKSYSADARHSFTIPIADSVTDQLFEITLNVSEIKAIIITADQAILLETNDSGTPADTISLVANKPYVWYTGSYFTNKLATDITKIYLTNASGSAATVEMEAVYDPTP